MKVSLSYTLYSLNKKELGLRYKLLLWRNAKECGEALLKSLEAAYSKINFRYLHDCHNLLHNFCSPL